MGITRLAPADVPRIQRAVPRVEWRVRPARATTSFQNVYGPDGRTQFVSARAPRLRAADIQGLRPQARIVHLGPILRETGPSVVAAVRGRPFVALTGQGLLRAVDARGRVRLALPRSAAQAFAAADLSVLSTEDVDGDAAMARALLARSRVGVLTDGERPIHAHEAGRWFEFPVTPRPTRNPTGAGDVFAAALFSSYHASGDLRRALGFAAEVAAHWISAPDGGALPGGEGRGRVVA